MGKVQGPHPLRDRQARTTQLTAMLVAAEWDCARGLVLSVRTTVSSVLSSLGVKGEEEEKMGKDARDQHHDQWSP